MPPPLFFKETWQLNGPAHAIAAGENVLTNTNLELKRYGPSAAAADPDKRIWIMPGSGHGSGGYVNVASFEVFGKPVKRDTGTR